MNTIPLDETEKSQKKAASPNRVVGRMAASSEGTKEEADYVNVAVCTVDKEAAPPDQRRLLLTRSLPLIAVCWLILLLIVGLRLHFTSLISEHNTKLTAEIQNLRRERNNLTVQLGNLTQNYTVLESKITNLTTQNQQLETEKNNLTEQIQTMETNQNELNVSRAQWSIDSYCRKDEGATVRTCKACQAGWVPNKSSCYAIHDAALANQRTWEQARGDCGGKISDLAIVQDQQEKDVVDYYSWGTIGCWIGLRVEAGKWKWIDGTDLTESSWIEAPVKGHCATSIKGQGWRSVMCDERKQWICVKEALTV